MRQPYVRLALDGVVLGKGAEHRFGRSPDYFNDFFRQLQDGELSRIAETN